MDTINQLAYNAGAYAVFHPIRTLTGFLTALAVCAAVWIWAHITDGPAQ
jgi:hypothetical protein